MDTLVTDELWNILAPLGPPHPPSGKGGRTRLPDRLCLNGILFVLRESIRWQSLPLQLGWGSGSTCWRRITEWIQAGVWEKAQACLVVALGERGLLNWDRAVVDSCSVCALRGGEYSGANPTDRAKKGCKRHLITDGQGIALVVQIGPANSRNEHWLSSLLWWLWIVLSCGCRDLVGHDRSPLEGAGPLDECPPTRARRLPRNIVAVKAWLMQEGLILSARHQSEISWL
jgi:transposase